MKPKLHQAVLTTLLFISPTIVVAQTGNGWLWLYTMACSWLVCQTFGSVYRQFKPWAIEAIGGDEPRVTEMTIVSVAAELSILLPIAMGMENPWFIIGARTIAFLIQVTQIGRMHRETEEHFAKETRHETRRTEKHHR